MFQLNIEFDMTNISITIPDDIAKASNEVAKKLGLSRTAFIRQAIIHELDNLQSKFEQEWIIKSFNAMIRIHSIFIRSRKNNEWVKTLNY